MISLDTETTGMDHFHGALPYFITAAFPGAQQVYWEWDVDPLTRRPRVQRGELLAIQRLIMEAGRPLSEGGGIVLQNAKYDIHALTHLFHSEGLELVWPWEATHDTLIMSHVLASNQPHDLTSLASQYLREDIGPLEKALERVVKEARRRVRGAHPDWRIAKAGESDMPSVKEATWKIDGWLPMAYLRAEPDAPEEYAAVLREYANADSAITYILFPVLKKKLKERDLWEIYLEALRLPRVLWEMETHGVTVCGGALDALREEFQSESERAAQVCVSIARNMGYDLHLPRSGNNGSLLNFCFNHREEVDVPEGVEVPYQERFRMVYAPLALPPLVYTEKGAPSLNKQALDGYLLTLPPGSRQHTFIQNLQEKRQRDTAISYLESYRRFLLPCEEEGYYLLHPSVNQTGTDTLRFSCSNPNGQNVAKGGFNLRRAFGPAPGRIWVAWDYINLELVIPAYEAGETDMIRLFEHPEEAPYYGSYHLLVFDTLYPDLFRKYGVGVKDEKREGCSEMYRWTKNGNFAVQYGAQESSGTADRAYHYEGAQRRIQDRFSKIARHSRKLIAFAERHGYVETVPDRTVNSRRGYPLLCTRTESGRILPTVPLSYRTQGTAMQAARKALWRTWEYLQTLNREDPRGHYLVLQVHDEEVADFPLEAPGETMRKAAIIQKIMEKSGEDIGIPLRCSVTYHPVSWGEGCKKPPEVQTPHRYQPHQALFATGT
jgi:DNA polymerase I-like protein with 3'-5' exonuclease and polymerase domains